MEEERKEPDWFPNAKVYHNGSHYIGIPHTTNKRKKRPKPQEKVFVIREETDKKQAEGAVKSATLLPKLELWTMMNVLIVLLKKKLKSIIERKIKE